VTVDGVLLRHCRCSERRGRRSAAALLQKLKLSGVLTLTGQATGHGGLVESSTALYVYTVKILRAVDGG